MITGLVRIAVSRAVALMALTGIAGLSGCITTSDAENRWGLRVLMAMSSPLLMHVMTAL